MRQLLLLLTIMLSSLMVNARIYKVVSVGTTQTTEADSAKSGQERTLAVILDVKDRITHDGIDSTLTAQLISSADSSFVDSVDINFWTYDGKRETMLSVQIKKPGNYLLRLNADGYRTHYVPVSIPKIYRTERFRQLKAAYMHRLPRRNDIELDEVVVKATKLKFYMDGDTLVYDADAFTLAEGSMLDALIRQLPGVELKDGGEITQNGRRVEALLLNGKDFFDSDRELLLDNMPAYMVKQVQTYERVPVQVKGTNREKTTPKELVMNVRLKREYSAGWIANAEGGGGTALYHGRDNSGDGKFTGRLFGLHFNDNGRVALYANVNNLNDDRTPGDKGEWSPLTQSQGLMKTYKVGGNALFGDWEKPLRYEGSFKASYYDKDDANHSAGETFLQGGSTFSRSFYTKRSYDYQVETDHRLRLNAHDKPWTKNATFSLNPSFNHLRWNNHTASAQVELSEDVASQLGKAWMDSISAPNAGDLLRRYAINRTVSSTKGIGHWTDASMYSYLSYNLPHNEMLDLYTSLNYRFTDRGEDNFEHYRLDSSQPTFLNKFNPTSDRTHNLSVTPEMSIAFDRNRQHSIQLAYTFSYNHQESNNPIYLLNKLKEWGDSTSHSIGTLPSVDEMMQTIDMDNSSRKANTTDSHAPRFTYQWTKQSDNSYSMLNASLSVRMNHERLDYWQGVQADTTVSRNTTFLRPGIEFYHFDWKRQRNIRAGYSLNSSAPSMTSLLDITNTSNPLYVVHSNPHLKNSHSHELHAYYSDKYGRTLFSSHVDGTIEQNSVASGFLYDRATGVRTVMPENVNGNWRVNFNSGVDFPLAKGDKWRMEQKVSYGFNHSVDLSGTGDMAVAERSVVATHNINDHLELTLRPNDKMHFSAVGAITWQHSLSDRTDFVSINAFDFNYGATAHIELPLAFQFSTDLTMYSRRGYSESSMNTNELVWNARASKRFMNGRITLMLDAFDILGNLSNVRRSVNAQGRTETFYNVIPSYVLLRLAYRFDKQPKKR